MASPDISLRRVLPTYPSPALPPIPRRRRTPPITRSSTPTPLSSSVSKSTPNLTSLAVLPSTSSRSRGATPPRKPVVAVSPPRPERCLCDLCDDIDVDGSASSIDVDSVVVAGLAGPSRYVSVTVRVVDDTESGQSSVSSSRASSPSLSPDLWTWSKPVRAAKPLSASSRHLPTPSISIAASRVTLTQNTPPDSPPALSPSSPLRPLFPYPSKPSFLSTLAPQPHNGLELELEIPIARPGAYALAHLLEPSKLCSSPDEDEIGELADTEWNWVHATKSRRSAISRPKPTPYSQSAKRTRARAHPLQPEGIVFAMSHAPAFPRRRPESTLISLPTTLQFHNSVEDQSVPPTELEVIHSIIAMGSMRRVHAPRVRSRPPSPLAQGISAHQPPPCGTPLPMARRGGSGPGVLRVQVLEWCMVRSGKLSAVRTKPPGESERTER